MKKTSNNQKSESRIQQEIFVWFTNNYCLPKHTPKEVFFHVANEGQHRLTNIGVLAGVSDVIFSFRGEWLFCEVKDARGKQSPAQKKFEKDVTALGSRYFIVRSLEDFKNYLLNL